MAKFLLFVRHSTEPTSQPSPEEMQALGAAWYAWMNKFNAAILPGGDGLKPEGKVIRDGIVSDGPYVEAKEFIASFTIIQADDIEGALAIARECPGNPLIEIREMAGYA
ncbi:YciI family protein [Singulisphaera sp. PoT]|uniref:YciI family protein n=1 Tax=Singulisphaera sp. PoT TaxID=3411797 RepID=UPI003BF48FBA